MVKGFRAAMHSDFLGLGLSSTLDNPELWPKTNVEYKRICTLTKQFPHFRRNQVLFRLKLFGLF